MKLALILAIAPPSLKLPQLRKLEFTTFKFFPLLRIAPPQRVEVLLMNVEFIIDNWSPVLMIDPPLVKLPEYPFANIKFLRVIFEPVIVNILTVLFA